jgi:transcription elongation GreA/GreB family factor
MSDIPEDELTSDVMLTEIQRMARGSITITINEYRDIGQTIDQAVATMLNDDTIDTDQADNYIDSGTVVQITVNGEVDDETIDILGPTLEDAIGNMYFYLKAEE